MGNRRNYCFTMLTVAIMLALLTTSCSHAKDVKVKQLQDNARVLAREAVAFQQQGKDGAAQTRYHEAVGEYMKILDVAPRSYEAWLNLGILYNFFKDYPKASEALDKAIALNESEGRAHFYRGFVYLETGETRQAELEFKMAAEREPEYAPSQFFYGKVEYELGEHFRARLALKEYLKLDPGGTYSALASDYLKKIPEDVVTSPGVELLPQPSADQTQPPPAQVNPQPPPAQPTQPETPKPKPEPTPPVKPVPEKPKPVDPPKPKPAPKPVTPSQPEKAPTTYKELIEAGQGAMAVGDTNTALDYLKKAYQLEPLFSEVNYLLGKVYHSKGDYQKGIDHLNIALQQKPGDSSALLELAYCYEGKGDIKTAIQKFEAYLAIKDSEKIRKHVEDLKNG